MAVPTPTQDQIGTALRGFLLNILPPGVDVIRGLDNRVPEPRCEDFVVATAINRTRLSTNVDSMSDCAFTGSIAAPVPTQATATIVGSITAGVLTLTDLSAGTAPKVGQIIVGVGIPEGVYIVSINQADNGEIIGYVLSVPTLTVIPEAMMVYLPSPSIMTVTVLTLGSIAVGATIFGPSVPANVSVLPYGTAGATGTGGLGTYAVTPCIVVSSGLLAAGSQTLTESTELVFQLDVHGQNSADNTAVINAAFRDEYAFDWFAENAPAGVTPLLADDARQIPFISGENQYETRYIIDCHLQAIQSITFPLQFASVLDVDVISVDAAYPAYPPP